MAPNNLLRVTQMNAVYFDKEVYNIFTQHLQECFKYLPPGVMTTYEPEIHLLLRLAIFNYSIISHNCTFGQKLLSIKYDNINTPKKLCMVLLNCSDYIRQRLELWKPSHPINSYVYKISLFLQFWKFWNISWFLRAGEKPLLVERVLDLKQVYCKDNVPRHYEDKYMTRELIWNGFIEILVYMVPLINYHKISRVFKHLNPLHKKPESVAFSRMQLTHDMKCPHCEEYPVHPSHMGCSHVFCYSCLKGNQAADRKYECPICEYSSIQVLCEKL